MRDKKGSGFKYRDHDRNFSEKVIKPKNDPFGFADASKQDKLMEISLLQKLHNNTLVVGLLKYKGELKGVRFYDSANRKFIDIAPWHLSKFSISKLEVMGVREIELFRHEAGNSPRTLVVEFLSKQEINGHFRAIRMVSDNLAAALSGITNYMRDDDYNMLLRSFVSEARGE